MQNLKQTLDRENRIAKVERTLRELNRQKRLLDEQAFVDEICNDFMISDRMAKEYIRIAKSRIPEWTGKEWAKPSSTEE